METSVLKILQIFLDDIFEAKAWCDMKPCLEHETCAAMEDLSGWTCTFGDTTKNVVIRHEHEEEKGHGEGNIKNDEQNEGDLEMLE